ncbi:MAG: riboflavin synthase, partial [Patescibacteria group bacterium]
MFTGITQTISKITKIQYQGKILCVSLNRPKIGKYKLGDSILLNGICSTITNLTKQTLTVEYMPETLQLTTVDSWQAQQPINVEAPLTLQTGLAGGLVTGHVDGVGVVKQFQQLADNVELIITYAKCYQEYVMLKGGITINGVNLTISNCSANSFSVKLIPYTLTHTTLNTLKKGDKVNLEFDYITKSVVNYL